MFLAMSAMLILFIAMMSLISARHYRSVTESLRLRFDNADLVDDLAAARDRQQAINRELEGQMGRRTEAALQPATGLQVGRNHRYRYHIADVGAHPGRQSRVRRLTGHRHWPRSRDAMLPSGSPRDGAQCQETGCLVGVCA
jgi:hypothetical protein